MADSDAVVGAKAYCGTWDALVVGTLDPSDFKLRRTDSTHPIESMFKRLAAYHFSMIPNPPPPPP